MTRKRTFQAVVFKTVNLCAVGAVSTLALSLPVVASPIVFSAAGNDAASIQGEVDDFRAQLDSVGPRLQINWDGTPDAFSAPNNLPPDFFNTTVPRGTVFSTPGTGFQVSGAPGVAPIEFDNIDPSYSSLFTTFSAPRLFTALDSTITDVHFFVPGTSTPATTVGFGAVFTDVDLEDSTSMEYFDADGNSLGTFEVEAVPDSNETLSFLGVFFDEGAVISRVRIISGNQVLAPGTSEDDAFTLGEPNGKDVDLVVMDDFIFGEPVAAAEVPEPVTLGLLGMAMLSLLGRRGSRIG